MTPAGPVAVTAKVEVPATDGVPARTPPEESVSPAGSAPEATAKVYGPAGPEAVRPCEYGSPTRGAGKVAGVKTTGSEVTVMPYTIAR